MRALFTWLAVCGLLIVAGMCIGSLPDSTKGLIFTGSLVVVTVGFLVRICKGSV